MNWVDRLISPIRNSVSLHLGGFPDELSKFVIDKYESIAQVRTVVNSERNVALDTVYVSPSLESSDGRVSELDVCEALESPRNVVVIGYGGSGKSMFLRSLWRSMAKRGSRVPIFLELRTVSDHQSDIIDILLACSFGRLSISREKFLLLLADGRFTLLIDGFDELKRGMREPIEKSILKLADDFPNNSIIVTGRPDDRFASWTSFSQRKTCPLDYTKFRELISKVEFDLSAKAAFLEKAQADFFEKHVEFLSNPLLALMMLISYRENAEIPSRLSIFYEQCFSALFRKHDATKQAFEREKSLDRIGFERVFSVFSLLTYQDRTPSFGSNYFHDTLSEAIAFLEIPDEQRAGIEEDFIRAVNLIAKEGESYFYIHRSFQEYFAALCVTRVLVEEVGEALSGFADDRSGSAFQLCCELHEDLVKEKFLIPELRELSNLMPEEHPDNSPFHAIQTAEGKGYMRVTSYNSTTQTTIVELNGWIFSLNERLERFYRCIACLSDELKQAFLNANATIMHIPEPLCNAYELRDLKIDRSAGTEVATIRLWVDAGDLHFSIDAALDIDTSELLEGEIERNGASCKGKLLEGEINLRSLNLLIRKEVRSKVRLRKRLVRGGDIESDGSTGILGE